MALSNASLTSTASNVYVSSGNTVISVAYFLNLDGTAVNLNLWAVPDGSSATDSNQIYRNVQIASGDTFVVDMEKLVLTTGDSIVGNASGNITATVSYVGI